MEFRRGGLTSPKERLYLLEIIEEACTAGASQQAACKLLGLTPRTLQRWKKETELIDKRTTRKTPPHNKLSKEEEKEVLEVVNQREYAYYTPTVIVPLLTDQKRYIASESTIYRLLKKEGQLRHRAASRPSRIKKPKEILATGPNQVYTWDITYLLSAVKGSFFYLYLFMDIFSRKIVGYQVYSKESSVYAADIIEHICIEEGIEKEQLTLHSDNGSPMKGATMLASLQKLGVIPSFSRPGVSDDNPYSEALFRTLKYTPMYPSKPFESLEKARKWVDQFVKWYNTKHLHSGIKFVTPEQRHKGRDEKILKQREEVYQKAKEKNPHRWIQGIRNWKKDYKVLLNPEKGKSSTNFMQMAV